MKQVIAPQLSKILLLPYSTYGYGVVVGFKICSTITCFIGNAPPEHVLRAYVAKNFETNNIVRLVIEGDETQAKTSCL